MGKAIAIKSGIVQKQANDCRKNKPSDGNMRKRKLKAEMKRLTEQVARTSNEIYQKTSKKEKDSQREKRDY